MPKINLKVTDTIIIGSSAAPHQLIIIINLSCRYCKKFWQRNKDNILKAVKLDKLQLNIKFFIKNSAPLRIGNIASQYINFNDPDNSFEFISNLIKHQNKFKHCSTKNAGKYLEKNYNVTKHNTMENMIITTNKLKKSGVRGIPTIILDDEWHDSFKYHLPKLY